MAVIVHLTGHLTLCLRAKMVNVSVSACLGEIEDPRSLPEGTFKTYESLKLFEANGTFLK